MATVHDLNDDNSICKKRRTLEIELPDKEQKLSIKQLHDQKDVFSSIAREEDRISELPDHLLSFIVSYLTLRDAVKTSVLSHRWRRICASRLSLKFDWHNILPREIEDKLNKLKEEYNIFYCLGWAYPMDKFVNAVNQFLQFYDHDDKEEGTGTQKIVAFELCLCLGRGYTRFIDQWITFATKMGVENLTISFDCGCSCLPPIEEMYVLRREFLSQGKEFNLKYLELSNCNLGPNLFTKFCYLTTLNLENVRLGLSDVQTICTCCLSLSTLLMHRCYLPLKLRIFGSLLRLRILTIFFCFGVKEIELSAMNLLRFKYSGLLLVKHSFLKVPKLEEVHFSVYRETDMHYIFQQLAKDLPNLRMLHVSVPTKSFCIPKSIGIFSKVETLELCFSKRTIFDAVKVIAILKGFPLLKKFYMMMPLTNDFEEGGMLEPNENVHELEHEHLKEVHLAEFYADPSQINFSIYLIKHARALERLVIDPTVLGIPKLFGVRLSSDERQREEIGKILRENVQKFSKDVVLII